MKKAIYIFIAVGLLSLTNGDALKADEVIEAKRAETKIEALLNRKDQLLVKEVYTLDKITGLYLSSGVIRAIVAYEPEEKEARLKGLIMELEEGQNSERTCTSYLDAEEIQGLSAAIGSMVRLVEERNKKENFSTEILYTTRDDLTFGVYAGETDEGGFISTGGEGKLTLSLETNQISEVKKIVDYGHTLLKMK